MPHSSALVIAVDSLVVLLPGLGFVRLAPTCRSLAAAVRDVLEAYHPLHYLSRPALFRRLYVGLVAGITAVTSSTERDSSVSGDVLPEIGAHV